MQNKSLQPEEVAGDTLTSWNTPGQLLLKSLQASEQARKERISGTITAKMKEARDKLPTLQPKHPSKSDQAIFGDPEHVAGEVQSLPADIQGRKVQLMALAAFYRAITSLGKLMIPLAVIYCMVCSQG